MTEEPSSQSGLPEEDPQLGKRTKMCCIFLFSFLLLTLMILVAENTGLAQVEVPVVSSSTEDSALQTSAGEPSVVEFVAAPALEATTITVLEVSATISLSTEPPTGLIYTPGELAPASVDTTRTIVERGSRSAPARLSPPWTSWKNWRIRWYDNSSPPEVLHRTGALREKFLRLCPDAS